MLGMTPEQYRAKWNFPSTYPMVAPNSTAQRSAFAKSIGFGLREKPIAAQPASSAAIEVVTVEPTSGTKHKAKAKSNVIAAAPAAPVKRKPGRPRKATA